MMDCYWESRVTFRDVPVRLLWGPGVLTLQAGRLERAYPAPATPEELRRCLIDFRLRIRPELEVQR